MLLDTPLVIELAQLRCFSPAFYPFGSIPALHGQLIDRS